MENSYLPGNFKIENGAVCSSVRSLPSLQLHAQMVVQELTLKSDAIAAHPRLSTHSTVRHAPTGSGWKVLMVFGVNDPIKSGPSSSSATFCHRAWSDLYAVNGQIESSIWPDNSSPASRTLWTARLFPLLPATVADDDTNVNWNNSEASGSVPVRGRGALDVDPSHALWFQAPSRPSAEVLQQWLAAPRVSIYEMVQLADAVFEFHSNHRLAKAIDKANAHQ